MCVFPLTTSSPSPPHANSELLRCLDRSLLLLVRPVDSLGRDFYSLPFAFRINAIEGELKLTQTANGQMKKDVKQLKDVSITGDVSFIPIDDDDDDRAGIEPFKVSVCLETGRRGRSIARQPNTMQLLGRRQ